MKDGDWRRRWTRKTYEGCKGNEKLNNLKRLYGKVKKHREYHDRKSVNMRTGKAWKITEI